jgi:hypothetical protein
MRLSIQTGQSTDSLNFIAQIKYCLNQLNLSKVEHIIKLTLFTDSRNVEDYKAKSYLLNEFVASVGSFNFPISLVSQPTINGGTSMEAWVLECTDNELTFSFSKTNHSSVLCLDNPTYSLLLSNQCSFEHTDFKENVMATFNLLDKNLHENGFDYNEIVRQWNYVENITMLDDVKDKQLQNYQIFNDIRTLFYNKSSFVNGYPAATGIGIENGGCSIEVIALKQKNENTVFPITNSLQVDAHNYSENVLVGNAIAEVKKVSTPKFERAKALYINDLGLLFVSGTASIVGEQTVFPDNVEKQTITTIENIEHLISVNNLIKNKITVTSHPELINYRVYLKNKSDYKTVKLLCDAHFGIKKCIFVKADICRSNLLIEIEAIYSI